MRAGEFDWAGVRFLAVDRRDAERLHAPGLFAFVRRATAGDRVMLFVDHAEDIGRAVGPGHPLWTDALRLGLDEVHVCLKPRSRLDRLQLRHHLVRRVGPILNLLGDEAPRVEPPLRQRSSG